MRKRSCVSQALCPSNDATPRPKQCRQLCPSLYEHAPRHTETIFIPDTSRSTVVHKAQDGKRGICTQQMAYPTKHFMRRVRIPSSDTRTACGREHLQWIRPRTIGGAQRFIEHEVLTIISAGQPQKYIAWKYAVICTGATSLNSITCILCCQTPLCNWSLRVSRVDHFLAILHRLGRRSFRGTSVFRFR